MEIKKADSKGRVTGFEPGRYYEVIRQEHGIITLAPIILKADFTRDKLYEEFARVAYEVVN